MASVDTSHYSKLRNTVRSTLKAGHLRDQRAVEQERIRTYWKAGDNLVHFLHSQPKEYGG